MYCSWRIVVDPGLGFAKSPQQCFELLKRLRRLHAALPSGIPLLIGYSRKRYDPGDGNGRLPPLSIDLFAADKKL